MKRLAIIILIITFIPICYKTFYTSDNKEDTKTEEKRGVFISYIELTKYLKEKSVTDSKKNIDEIIDNIYNLGFNTVILQIRSSSDAIYESKIFPWSSTVSREEGIYPGYDILDYFIKTAHNKNMYLYAWINPYRVRTTEDIASITINNPAYKYIGTDTLYINKGIYYNPSKKEVENLIVEGVLEVVKNYDVDGILFDDYFYPNNEIDTKDYEEYIKAKKVDKQEYNLMVINNLIKKVYEVCHKYDKEFGISPDGNIENNYNKAYADVKRWGEESGYVDFLMPQVYYGFFNETKAFKNVINEWEKIVKNNEVDLYFALAFYKVGTLDTWAKSGKEEWLYNDDIIMREIILSRNINKYKGFSLFRYDYLFNEELFTDMTMNEINNLKKIIKVY